MSGVTILRVEAYLPRDGFTLDVSFAAGRGVTALFGRSGSGKTSVIGVIAGLLSPARGRVELDGRLLLDTAGGIMLPRHQRRVGLVFQDAQLFPHMTVRQNLAFGRWFAPAAARGADPDTVIAILGISHLMDRRPAQLSGGEKQRVAIGRALLASPQLLALDEPLASLDEPRKLEILPLLETLAGDLEIPVIYVSHAVEEVTRLASKVVILEAGRVVAEGPPEQVFPGTGALSRPAQDRFGIVSVLSGRLGACDEQFALTTVEHPAGRLYLPGRIVPPGREVLVAIRATDVVIATERPRAVSTRNVLEGQVAAIRSSESPVAILEIALAGHGRLAATITRAALAELALREGTLVYALVKTVALNEQGVQAGRA